MPDRVLAPSKCATQGCGDKCTQIAASNFALANTANYRASTMILWAVNNYFSGSYADGLRQFRLNRRAWTNQLVLAK